MDRVFDFIIVGAGSAGCVLAERLSANGRHSVLVLEAGGSDRRFFIQMPLGYGKTFYDPSVNWMYAAEADPGLNGQRDYWPRGKVLGGSSSINAMVYIRGAREDYESWEAAGNTGWGWVDVLRSYRPWKIPKRVAMNFEGWAGRCMSAKIPVIFIRCASFVAAGVAAGFRQPGFQRCSAGRSWPLSTDTKGGQRMSAARAFLRPAMKRRNVRVVTHAQVTKVLFEGRRATGVEYLHRGLTKTAMAGREVILAGGAINSAQLLQLSGIGPAKVLQAHGIGVRLANPNVGAHLQDHVGLNYTYRMKVPTLNDALRPWWGKLRVGPRYVMSRGGPLSLSVNQGGGFFRSSPATCGPTCSFTCRPSRRLFPRWANAPCSRLIPSRDFPWDFPIAGRAAGALLKSNRLIRCSIRALWPMPIQPMKTRRDAGRGKIPAEDCGAKTFGGGDCRRTAAWACLRER